MPTILKIHTKFSGSGHTYVATVPGVPKKRATATAGGRHAAIAWLRRHYDVEVPYSSTNLVSDSGGGMFENQIHLWTAPVAFAPPAEPKPSHAPTVPAPKTGPTRRTRNHGRAADQTTLTISLSKKLKKRITTAAGHHGLPVSKFIARVLSQSRSCQKP